MSFVSSLRSRSKVRRNRRALERAIADAPTTSMRDEILLAAQRSGIGTRFFEPNRLKTSRRITHYRAPVKDDGGSCRL